MEEFCEILGQIGSELTCSLCKHVFEDPHSLPCQHHFCGRCIDEYLEDNSQCPVCICPFWRKDSRSNLAIVNITKVYHDLLRITSQASQAHKAPPQVSQAQNPEFAAQFPDLFAAPSDDDEDPSQATLESLPSKQDWELEVRRKTEQVSMLTKEVFDCWRRKLAKGAENGSGESATPATASPSIAEIAPVASSSSAIPMDVADDHVTMHTHSTSPPKSTTEATRSPSPSHVKDSSINNTSPSSAPPFAVPSAATSPPAARPSSASSSPFVPSSSTPTTIPPQSSPFVPPAAPSHFVAPSPSSLSSSKTPPHSTKPTASALSPPSSLIAVPVLVGTTLPVEMTARIHEACARFGGTLVSQFTSRVTHVVCKPSEPQREKKDSTKSAKQRQLHTHRTLKTVLGTLHAKWVVSIGWVMASLEANRWISEEEYEIIGDTMHPYTFGPRNSRIQQQQIHHSLLFAGFQFVIHPSPPNPPGLRDDELRQVIRAGGGTVFGVWPTHGPPLALPPQNGENKILMLCGPYMSVEQACALKRASNLAPISYVWLLDCVSHYKLIDFVGGPFRYRLDLTTEELQNSRKEMEDEGDEEIS